MHMVMAKQEKMGESLNDSQEEYTKTTKMKYVCAC